MSDSPGDDRCSRRRFLALCAALPLCACSDGGDVALVAGLRQVLHDPDGAARVGRLYLDQMSDTPVANDLLDRMFDAGTRRELRGADVARLRAAVAARHRADVEAGRLVSVDGWMLSRTEATLCAMLALR